MWAPSRVAQMSASSGHRLAHSIPCQLGCQSPLLPALPHSQSCTHSRELTVAALPYLLLLSYTSHMPTRSMWDKLADRAAPADMQAFCHAHRRRNLRNSSSDVTPHLSKRTTVTPSVICLSLLNFLRKVSSYTTSSFTACMTWTDLFNH